MHVTIITTVPIADFEQVFTHKEELTITETSVQKVSGYLNS